MLTTYCLILAGIGFIASVVIQCQETSKPDYDEKKARSSPPSPKKLFFLLLAVVPVAILTTQCTVNFFT